MFAEAWLGEGVGVVDSSVVFAVGAMTQGAIIVHPKSELSPPGSKELQYAD